MILKKYRKLIVIFTIIFSLLSFNLVLANSGGTYNFNKDSGLDATSHSAGYTQSLMQMTPTSIASSVIKMILIILGIIFLGLTIYAGLAWMLSEGNEEQVTKAKKILTAAITGLIIVLIAYAITYTLIHYFYTQSMTTPS